MCECVCDCERELPRQRRYQQTRSRVQSPQPTSARSVFPKLGQLAHGSSSPDGRHVTRPACPRQALGHTVAHSAGSSSAAALYPVSRMPSLCRDRPCPAGVSVPVPNVLTCLRFRLSARPTRWVFACLLFGHAHPSPVLVHVLNVTSTARSGSHSLLMESLWGPSSSCGERHAQKREGEILRLRENALQREQFQSQFREAEMQP